MSDCGRVVATDDQAALSKASCVRRKYWSDDALLKLIPKGPRRSPIIHAGYNVRYKLISSILHAILGNEFEQVIVLGAGSDTSFWRLNISKLYPALKWFEIDFPNNLKFKSREMESLYGQSDNYFPVPGDLRHMDQVYASLKAAGLNNSSKTFVISEVVLAYLTAGDSTNVIEFLTGKLESFLFVEFEQFNPSTSFGTVMTNHFIKIGSPIYTINKLPVITDRLARFSHAGFHKYRCFPLLEIAPPVVNIEPFDEYETLHYFLKHYYIGMGAINLDPKKFYPTSTCPQPKIKEKRKLWNANNVPSNETHRSFYASARYQNFQYLAGGLGATATNPTHRKLDTISRIDQNGNEEIVAEIKPVQSPQMVVMGNHLVLFGGRASPQKPSGNVYVFKILSYGELEKCSEISDPVFATYRSAVTAINDTSFVRFGGRKANGEFCNDLTIIEFNFTMDSYTTTKVENDFPALASATLSASDEDIFHLIGGLSDDGQICDQDVQFRITNKTEIEILNRIKLPFGIYDHCVHFKRDGSYIFIGGVTSMALENDRIIEFHPDADEIIIGEIESTDLILVGHSAHVDNDEIIVYGGGTNCFSFGTHFNALVTVLSARSS